jgi:integrase
VREDLGLPVKRPSFSVVARAVIEEVQATQSNGLGKVVHRDYVAVLERYLIPFFGRLMFEDITPEVIADFDAWRNTQIGKVPRASTMRTHASAFNRVLDAAKARGLLPLNKTPPALTVQGERSQPRPNFDKQEIDHLLAFLPAWAEQGRLSIERDIRPLLRDYVEFLLFTGVRHGTEARRLEWRHLQWHWEGEKRYLRVWVSGKTGPRYLIAKSGAIAALDRLAHRNWGKSLDQMIEEKAANLVFVCGTGYEPHGFEGSFRRLMRDSGLLKDSSGKNRTLYSLRHTYATFALRDGISIHTIARQMGTSVLMLERHYSKLTPMMNAAELGK